MGGEYKMKDMDKLFIGVLIIIASIGNIFYTNTTIDKKITGQLLQITTKQERLNERIETLSSKKEIKELQEFMKLQKNTNIKQAEFNQTVVTTFYRLYPKG